MTNKNTSHVIGFMEKTNIALKKDILIRSSKVALVVGTMLALINHGDAIITNTLTIESIIKIAVSYLVPFSVSTWSTIQAKKN